MPDEMRKSIIDYIIRELLDEEDDIEITPDTVLISSELIDSYSMVALKTFLEKKYKIRIPNDAATPEAFDTVNRIAALVRTYTG